MSQEFDLIAKHETEFAAASDDRELALRKQILDFVVLAVVCNVIFSIILAVFLVRDITARLKVLSDNAIRLAAHQPLERLPAGFDEISKLDEVFHEMAGALDESAKSKQEMVNMLTHDLRSPLAAIQGSLDILDAGQAGTLNDRGERLVKLAHRNSLRMLALINDLLDIEKIASNAMQIEKAPVAVADVFEEVKLSTADWIEEHDIRLSIQDTDNVVIADRDRLIRVVFNLVSNAIKFSPKGGEIRLHSRQIGPEVEVTVSDQGRGIPAKDLRLVFDRFQQLQSDKSKGGSGLGLYICQKIISLHDGKIWVTSEVGKGSVFHFTLTAA